MTLEQVFQDVGLTLVKKVKGTAKKARLQKKISVSSLSDRHLVIGKALEHWPRWFEKELWNIVSFELRHTGDSVLINVSLYEGEIVPEGKDKNGWLVSAIERRYRGWDSVEIEGELCNHKPQSK